MHQMKIVGLFFVGIACLLVSSFLFTGKFATTQAVVSVSAEEPRLASGVGTRIVELDRSISRGGSFVIDDLSVVNTGNVTTTYKMELDDSKSERDLDENHVRINFSPAEFTLEPEEVQRVAAQVQVALRTNPGSYQVYLNAVPQVDQRQDYEKIIISGTHLSFQVSSVSILETLVVQIEQLIFRNPIMVASVVLTQLAIAFLLVPRLKPRPMGWARIMEISLVLSLLLSFGIITYRIFMPKPDVAGTTVTMRVAISLCGDGQVDGDEDCDGVNLDGQSCSSIGFASGDLSCDVNCTFITDECVAPTPTPTPTPTITPEPTPTPTATPTTSTATRDTTSTTTSETTTTTTPIVDTGQPVTITDLVTILVTEPQDLAPAVRAFMGSMINTNSRTMAVCYADASMRDHGLLQPLPAEFQQFDQNHNQLIDHQQIPKAVITWVAMWRQNTPQLMIDFNHDILGIEALADDGYLGCDLNYDSVCSLADLSVLSYRMEAE